MKNKSILAKKALIVSPYLAHLGGGERYTLQVASFLQQSGYQTYFAWHDVNHLLNLANQLGISLQLPLLHPQIYHLYFSSQPLSMYLATKRYDVIFYLSDGSLPLLGGKNNILHFQVPFHNIHGRSFKNRFKLTTIHHIVVNSHFTKQVIDKEYGVDSQVIYPPISLPSHSPSLSKTNLILSVGRFEPSLNIKKQDILIQAFKKLVPHLPNWKLVLVGGAKPTAQSWISHLRHLATGFPIEIKPNLPHSQLQQLYQQATLYWHGAGYQVDESEHPELVEHFGITTVEAISYACLPLVVPKGGQKEIVPDSIFYWQTKNQLIAKTLQFIKNLPYYQSRLTTLNINRFSLNNFFTHFKSLL